MSHDKPVTAQDLREAAQDRVNITHPVIARVGIRQAMIAAAAANGSHKLAYKIDQAARRIKAPAA